MKKPLVSKPYYLSVDIDYWTDSTVTRFIWEFGKFLSDRPKHIPITAVMNHQQMLWNVNRTHVQRLVNLDFHSDLNDKNVEELHCGSWVSYVQWRRWGEYIWVRPKKDPSLGCCNRNDDHWNDGTDWKKAVSMVRSPENMDLRSLYTNCQAIGVCMSPAFINKAMQEAFLQIVTANKIPYRPGDPTDREIPQSTSACKEDRLAYLQPPRNAQQQVSSLNGSRGHTLLFDSLDDVAGCAQPVAGGSPS
jgi:hypothetical protein